MLRKIRLLLRAVLYAAVHPHSIAGVIARYRSGGPDYVASWVRAIGNGMAPMGAPEYRRWYAAVESNGAGDCQVTGWQPRISILMPVYNPPCDHLLEAVESVLAQTYANWELCVVDDASTQPHVAPLLCELAARDDRIVLCTHRENCNLSVARNTALELATGDIVTLLDHDDVLSPLALLRLAQAFSANGDLRIVYSDEDKLDQFGARCEPVFKPPWNPELYLCQNYVHHMVAFDASLLRRIGGYRSGYEGAEDYDCVFRASEQVRFDQIHHIPEVLYHWRRFTRSGSWLSAQVERVENVAVRVVNEHLERTRQPATVARSEVPGRRKLVPVLPHPVPSVTVVACEDAADGLDIPADIPIELCTTPGGEYAQLNEPALSATGDALLFLPRPLTPLSAEWLHTLLAQLWLGNAGAVGPKILTANNRVWASHGVLGGPWPGQPGHRGQPADSYGYDARLALLQRCSSVAFDGMLTRRDAFESLGGLALAHYGSYLAVTDYCLRLAQAGRPTVWVPTSVCRLHQRYDRALADERAQQGRATRQQREAFKTAWDNARDVSFSPSLSTDGRCDFAW